MTPRRVLTFAVLMCALAAGGCGGDDSGGASTAAFCNDVKRIIDENSDKDGQPSDLQAFGKAVDQLQQLKAPDEIADDYTTVMDAYEAKKPEDIDKAKVEAAGKRLTPWLEKHCKVSA